MEKALRVFGDLYEEGQKERNLPTYAKWVLETALFMLPALDQQLQAFCKYRDLEGLSEPQLVEARIATSLAQFRRKIAK